MANVLDYLHWRGDLSFQERPFNLIDNTILSEACYFDFHRQRDGDDDEGLTLREIAEKIESGVVYRSSIPDYVKSDFLAAVGMTRRFGNVRVRKFVKKHSRAKAIQFVGVSFELSEEETYVAYRGTDMTVAGWQENFMMSFQITAAQELAAKYLEKVIEPGKRYRVGGHSKGGNLAFYGAMSIAPELQEQILVVYNNDGPGVSESLLDETQFERIRPKVVRIVPGFSVVGMIFDREVEETHIVESKEFTVLQHNMLAWQVNPDSFQELPQLNTAAQRIDDIFAIWLEGLPEEERIHFVEDLFAKVAEENVVLLSQLSDPLKFEKVLFALTRMDWSTKMTLLKINGAVAKHKLRHDREVLSELKSGVIEPKLAKLSDMNLADVRNFFRIGQSGAGNQESAE